MKTNAPRIAAVLAALALTVAGCGEESPDEKADDAGSPPSLADIDGQSFRSTGDDSLDSPDHTLVPDSEIELGFDGSELSADAGCNHLFGTVEVKDGKLSASGMGGTEMGCTPELMAQDEWLTEFLGSSPSLELDSGVLTLTSGDSTLTLTEDPPKDARGSGDLVGPTWTLEAVTKETGNTSSGSASSNHGAVTLVITDEGVLEVETGCNTGSVAVDVTGDKITLAEDLVTTLVACPKAKGKLERQVLAVIESGPTYSIDGDTLTLTAADGVNGLQFSAAP